MAKQIMIIINHFISEEEFKQLIERIIDNINETSFRSDYSVYVNDLKEV